MAAAFMVCAGYEAHAAQQNATAAALKNPVAPSTESVAAGKQAYQRRCASCHGTTGEGSLGNDLIGPAPNLVDATWEHGSTDGEIFTNIKNGIGPDFMMVPWKDELKD